MLPYSSKSSEEKPFEEVFAPWITEGSRLCSTFFPKHRPELEANGTRLTLKACNFTSIQRMNQCLRIACYHLFDESCISFIRCESNIFTGPNWLDWQNNPNVTACISGAGQFNYGIFKLIGGLTIEQNIVYRYAHSSAWGFQFCKENFREVIVAGNLAVTLWTFLKHILNFFNCLPIPQLVLMILIITPNHGSTSSLEIALQALCLPIGFQYTFILAGHVVGSCWYLFGLERMDQCLRIACYHLFDESCISFIRCESNIFTEANSLEWQNNPNVTSCISGAGQFNYRIFKLIGGLTIEQNIVYRYAHSCAWGFQQMVSYASSLVPSYCVWESLFMMSILILRVFFFSTII